jgi:peptidoglycan-N-acetylglucosamine deacetylase
VTLLMWLACLVGGTFTLYIPVALVCLKAFRLRYSASLQHYPRTVCLTFDDGPDPASTPAILETLRAQGVRATFFVVGRNAKNHSDVLAAIVGDGHEIGEHGYSHLHPWRSTPWSYIRDLVEGIDLLDRLLGTEKRRRYRPTFGKANALTFIFAWLFHKTLTFWNVDPHDYREASEHRIFHSVLTQVLKTRGASVVLLHDGRTARWQRNTAVTAAAVELLCEKLRQEGYRFLALDELSS